MVRLCPRSARMPYLGKSYKYLLKMLEDAIQGCLEVASQQEEVKPEKELIELSL